MAGAKCITYANVLCHQVKSSLSNDLGEANCHTESAVQVDNGQTEKLTLFQSVSDEKFDDEKVEDGGRAHVDVSICNAKCV